MDLEIEKFRDKLYDLIYNSGLPAGVVNYILVEAATYTKDVHKQVVEQQKSQQTDTQQNATTEQKTVQFKVPLEEVVKNADSDQEESDNT